MRIISGSLRGKRLESHPGKELRPTQSRTREALFNVLSHGRFFGVENSPFIGQHVVDLFCGTGALGFEALSRGAERVTFVDENPRSIEITRLNAKNLGVLDKVSFIRSDSTKVPATRASVSLAFLDPPYHSNLALPAVMNMDKGGWFMPSSIIAIEQAKKDPVPEFPGFEIIDNRSYSITRIVILEKL